MRASREDCVSWAPAALRADHAVDLTAQLTPLNSYGLPQAIQLTPPNSPRLPHAIQLTPLNSPLLPQPIQLTPFTPTGASGGTPSNCNAPPVTPLNTGPATVPP